MKILCERSVPAINTGEILFKSGQEYAAKKIGDGKSCSVKDEFGAIQLLVFNNKFFRKNFKIVEA
ncbi:hypothetical protein [Chengkuizengella marina]|uniref:Uncharacterized protein n=1 Tax=Chengkuizengella marina TaxID=2507566 RepID=A0A6N9Q807_9BACL|nr:hypothetical protein [Chengkuizengella marina]NBI30998.1 hypothetical protein [Chengkuizengella marina]